MSSKMIELPRAIFDLMLHRPLIEQKTECSLLVGQQVRVSTGKEILTGMPPFLSDLQLLRLDRPDDLLIDERDDLLLMRFSLKETEIPLMAVITDQAIQRKRAEFIDP